MAGTTPKLALRYPSAGDADNVPSDIQNLATDVEQAVGGTGLLSARPAAGHQGKIWRATDTGQVFRDNGTTWDELVLKASADAAYRPLASRGVRVYKTAATANISNATFGVITWDVESHDTDAFHDNTTNATRLTVPANMGGLYLVTASLRFAGSTAGTTRACAIAVNGTTRVQTNALPSAADHTVAATDTIRLVAGDYVEILAYQDSGAGLSVVGASAAYTSASLAYLGA